MVIRTRQKKRAQVRRRAAATVEVVMATAFGFSAASLLAYQGMRACRNLFHVIGTMVGWPHL